jgi:hypothetical protein
MGKRARRRGPGAASILVIVLLVAAYFVPRGPMWNADSRVFLTASIVDRGRLDIDPFASATGDIARVGAHYYSDKAPGLSLAAVPVYAVLKYTLLGGQPYAALFAVPESQRIDFLPRYVLALVYAGLPTAILAALLYLFLARLGLSTRWCTLLSLTYGLGTFALPFGTVFFGHQLAAVLLFGAFYLFYRVAHGELGARSAALAGGLAGYAVITEYPTALIVALLLLYVAWPLPARWRLGLAAVLGMLPALALAAIYNTLAFGGPLSQGYAHLHGPSAFIQGQASGFMGITYPHLDALWQTTFGAYRGLFVLSPVLLLALPGWLLLVRWAEWRREAVLWAGIVVVYFLFVVSYFEWSGGDSLGPRHFLPALPFLVLSIGALVAPERARCWKIATAALAGVSILIITLATATGPLPNAGYDAPLTEYVLPSLVGLPVNPHLPAPTAATILPALGNALPFFPVAQLDNNWGMLLGLPGLLQLVPLGVAVGLALAWRWWRGMRAHVTIG